MTLKTPYKDLLPPLSTEERETLKADIKENGILQSIIIDEKENILDGHNRYDIAPRGTNIPTIVLEGLTEAEKKAFVIRSNLQRRNLSPSQKKDLQRTAKKIVGELREEDHKYWTQNKLAEVIGYDRSTVSKWLTTNVTNHNSCKHDSRVKVDPREKPVIVERVASGETQTQIAADYGTTPQAISKIVTEETKKAETKKEREKAAKKRKGNNGVIHGDFRKGAIEPDSYDLIFTDPPYDKEAVELYGDLADYASKTLVEGGWLLAYAGHAFLPEIYAAIAGKLTYAWTFCILHSGGDLRYRKFKVQNGWKPIIAAYRPKLAVDWEWFKDVVTGGKEKSDHPWQQAESEAAYFIEQLCPKGGMVCDPFCGSGTTLVAAKSLGRKYVGFEIEEEHVHASRGRLDD